jgi:hypothetical protein
MPGASTLDPAYPWEWKAETLTRAIALALLALAGCAAEPVAVARHDLPQLSERRGTRVLLRTDLGDPNAAAALERLEKLEALLDRRFPWLMAARDPVTVLVIEGEGAFHELAHAHGVPPGGASAFSCSAGEVVIRWKPEEWGQGPIEGWVQSPRSSLVAEVLFRRRLEANYGASIERTSLEDGCARLFSEDAALELGERREAARRSRDDLLEAFLPLFLGSEPVLAKTALARGSNAVVRAPANSTKPLRARAVAYAVARFLLDGAGGRRAEIVPRVFDAAAGRLGAEEELAREPDLRASEAEFDRWLRDATVESLLAAVRDEPVLAARWEALGALRVLTAVNLDIDDGASSAVRAEIAAGARAEIAARKTVLFAEEFDAALDALRGRHQPGGLERLVAQARAELDDRARGYGHPAIEEFRGQIGRVLEARLKNPPGS